MIYARDHSTLLHTKYISFGPHGFREEDVFKFSHYKSMGVHSPVGGCQFGPQGLDWQDLCRRPPNIATYKYKSCGPHGFREEDFLSFSHYKSMGAIYRHGGHLELRTVTIFTNFQSSFKDIKI